MKPTGIDTGYVERDTGDSCDREYPYGQEGFGRGCGLDWQDSWYFDRHLQKEILGGFMWEMFWAILFISFCPFLNDIGNINKSVQKLSTDVEELKNKK